MENETRIGVNRTGMQMAPLEGPRQVEAANAVPPTHPGSTDQYASERAAYTVESDRIGSVPLPGTVKGVMATTVDKITGKRPEVLIDKLGQRLAFERTGVRLYQAMIAKVASTGDAGLGALHRDLVRIAEDEHAHFLLLVRTVESLGADPTAQTPCADVSGVTALGVMQVLTDPRTTVAQGLDALLTIELTDNAAWELLISLAREAGHAAIADSFLAAHEQEEEHLMTIRRWLRETVMSQARLIPTGD